MRKLFFSLIFITLALITRGQTLYSTTTHGGMNGGGTICKLDSGRLTAAFHLDTPDGSYPSFSTLLQASDGKLYGTTASKGKYDDGTIFSYNPSTHQYTTVKYFNYTDGAFPYGKLMQAKDGKLYGMTRGGGAYFYGVIFSFDINTGIYVKLKDLDRPTGCYPYGGLVQAANGKLYGMTSDGGSYNKGVLFSFNPATAIYTKLTDFNGDSGENPYGDLIQAKNGKFYGMTGYGGSNDMGVIFSFTPSTALYQKLLDLTEVNGSNPWGSLMQASNGNLYGMTLMGGSSHQGVIFSYNISTAAYIKLKDLDSYTGCRPFGSLFQAKDGQLYGMTSNGGNTGTGDIFCFNTATNSFSVKKNFNWVDGRSPRGSLIQAADNKLYGMSDFGGGGDVGALFSFDISNDAYIKIRDFGINSNGNTIQSSLVNNNNGLLYGLTPFGGSNGSGVIFSFNPANAAYNKLKDFDYDNGANPLGGLLLAKDGKMYGTTNNGGSYKSGVIFSYDPVTAVYTKLIDFYGTTGSLPFGSLIQANDGKLYGMTTYGGSSGVGVLFSYDVATSVYTKLKDFDYTTGYHPRGSLLQGSDGKLYGMTWDGGTKGYGVIFSFDITTAAYTILVPFDYTNGAQPSGSLMQAKNGILYGVTGYGGSNSDGVLFSYDINSHTYTKLRDFSASDGTNPDGSLIQASDGKLYGLTAFGGTFSAGTSFSFEPATATYTKLQDFDSATGSFPHYTSFTAVYPVLKVSNASAQEGNNGQKSMTFTVTLSSSSNQPVTVDYKTKDGTAIAPADYVAQKGRLTFAPGVIKQTISIFINGDVQVEGDEKFKVLLGNAVNATISDNTGVGTILNDDIGFAGRVIATTSNSSKPIVAVSPNPVLNLINVTFKGFTGNITIELRTVEGILLQEAKVKTNNLIMLNQQFDVAKLSSGTYFIVVADQKNKQTIKFIKE